MNKAARQYVIRFSGSMLAYAIVLILSIRWISAMPDSPWRYPIVVLPVIPFGFGLLAFLRFFREMDELQRKIQFEGIAFAFGATIAITLTYGFLEGAGLPHLSWIFAAPMMIALWGIGVGLASWRYS